jgi:hypothetical protein
MATKRKEERNEETDVRSEGGLEGDMQDAKRYRYLRDCVRNSDGSVNEKLYVRCDGRIDGRWALDGEELDKTLDLLITNLPDAPEGAPAKAA